VGGPLLVGGLYTILTLSLTLTRGLILDNARTSRPRRRSQLLLPPPGTRRSTRRTVLTRVVQHDSVIEQYRTVFTSTRSKDNTPVTQDYVVSDMERLCLMRTSLPSKSKSKLPEENYCPTRQQSSSAVSWLPRLPNTLRSYFTGYNTLLQ